MKRPRAFVNGSVVGLRAQPGGTPLGRFGFRLTVGCGVGAMAFLLAACGSGGSDTTVAAETTLAVETTVGPETTAAAESTTETSDAADTVPPLTAVVPGSTSPATTVGSAVPTATTAPPTTTTTTLMSTAPSSTLLGSPSTVMLSQRCQAPELAASLGRADVGAGNLYQPLVVRNIGQRTCTLDGYPGVSILDAAGVQIGEPAERAQGVRATISIAPGAAASALLHTTNGPIGDPCLAPSVSMKMYPPNETEPLTFAVVYTTCGGFSVRPFVAGELGQ